MNRVLFLAVVCLVVFALTSSASNVPKLINYQGMLTNAAGTPLNGGYMLVFKIYDGATGGAALLWIDSLFVQVNQGLFSAVLGSGEVLNLAFDRSYWLEIVVNYEVMPRVQLTSVGYAYRAQTADSAVTSAKITVPLSLSGSSSNPIISGTNSGTGDGVDGYTSGGIVGVYGQSNKTGGYGVWGVANSGSLAAGIIGSSSNGYGVYGSSTNSTGVTGYTTGGMNGVLGQSDKTNGTGVYGVAHSGSGAWGV